MHRISLNTMEMNHSFIAQTNLREDEKYEWCAFTVCEIIYQALFPSSPWLALGLGVSMHWYCNLNGSLQHSSGHMVFHVHVLLDCLLLEIMYPSLTHQHPKLWTHVTLLPGHPCQIPSGIFGTSQEKLPNQTNELELDIDTHTPIHVTVVLCNRFLTKPNKTWHQFRHFIILKVKVNTDAKIEQLNISLNLVTTDGEWMVCGMLLTVNNIHNTPEGFWLNWFKWNDPLYI